ncbi:MAG: 2OG-Fe(II) oxygenase [Thiothrix sp.]|nr:2OG-Fe(II) oxygenase [Thiothrix sp.]HPQ95792.1 2OG-Fe(II) oxygenase [Thiolinea sp.]
MPNHALPDEDLLKRLADTLYQQGYLALPDALPPPLIRTLQNRIQALDNAAFHPAGIGREQDYRHLKRVRSDRIHWLDSHDPATRSYFDWMEALRLGLNRTLFLGLFDYECHFAWYPQGARYQTHLDAFRGNNNRRLSTVLYLNPDWQTGDGGELVIHAPLPEQAVRLPGLATPSATPELLRIQPLNATLVLFLSEVFPHEVLPAHKPRYSITGWFRVNTSSTRQADPPA